MRSIARICPCGGEVVVKEDEFVCLKCDALFEEIVPLYMVKRGRDDSVQEGSLARVVSNSVGESNVRLRDDRESSR